MVVHAYYPVGETRVQREALALVDRGHEVDVLCLRGPGEPRHAEHDGVSVHRLPVRRHRHRGLAVQLLEYLAFLALAAAVLSVRHARRPYDVVQVHNLPDFLVFCAIVPKLAGAACILDLHDLMPEFLASRMAPGTGHPLVRIVALQERLACRFADHVITVTDVWRDTLIGRGVPADKVHVVMNLADTRIFHRPASPTAEDGRRYGFRLMYHGTFTHRYGVDLLLDAVAVLRDDIPGLTLTLLGAGDARDDLLARRARLGLEDRVTISADMVDATSLPAKIAEADAGVVPTRSDTFTDGLLPTKLMEYVAMGTPVIAARTPTVATYFDDDMLQFFAPGDVDALAAAIRALASDRARLPALAENADAVNRKYQWDAMAAAYAGLVERAADAHAPATDRGVPTTRVRARRPTARHAATRTGDDARISTAAEDPAWDAFLASLPGGHHTQTSLWARVKSSMGWQAARVVVERQGHVVGGAQILYRRVPAVGAIGYVSRGPVLAADDDALGARILDEVENVTRELRIRHLTVQPPGSTDEAPPFFTDRPYLASDTEVAPRATVLLDVTAEPDQILAAMSSKTRYNIRLSGRRSVTVREGDAIDIGAYHRILVATASRQGFEAAPRRYFDAMLDVLAPGGHVRLCLGEIDGTPVSGQLAVAFGDTVVNKLSVWSGEGGRDRPNEALQWATIQWAHAHGFHRYDLEGLRLEAAHAVLHGEAPPASTSQSVTSYKLGFGGEVVVMPAACVWIPNRVARWGYAHAYPRLREAQAVRAAIKRLRTAAVGSN
jgi:glycosyltransferase involved in cell wall biosynthesis/lipid II:glycine glycyltransferase (peptidoglycan interpeptide bridge formation enzyme)